MLPDARNEPARHHRQALLREVGEAGQARVVAGHAAVVGCGALGTVAAEWLVRAGVGRVTLIDRDVVELTNLQRQVLFDESDAREGAPKAEAARRRLAAIDPGVRIDAVITDANAANIERLLGVGSGNPGGPRVPGVPGVPGGPVVLDCTDNFATRYLLNDVAVKHGLALIYAGVIVMRGVQMNILPALGGACLRCVFPEPPDATAAGGTCDTVGVLGPAVGVIASVQAAEAFKAIVGAHGALGRGVFEVDVWGNTARRVGDGARDGACPCCSARRFAFLDGARAQTEAALCGRGAVQVAGSAGAGARVDLAALAARLSAHGAFEATRFLVRGTLTHERADENGESIGLTVFADGRAIVTGTERVERARAVYARYVGG